MFLTSPPQKNPSDLLSKRFESSGSILLGPQKIPRKLAIFHREIQEKWPEKKKKTETLAISDEVGNDNEVDVVMACHGRC